MVWTVSMVLMARARVRVSLSSSSSSSSSDDGDGDINIKKKFFSASLIYDHNRTSIDHNCNSIVVVVVVE